jgi:hypothetical protein
VGCDLPARGVLAVSAENNAMVTAAARALCKNASEVCNVDFEDNWKIYGDEIYKPEAQLALDACGALELLAACRLAMMLKRVGGMLPGVKELVDEVVREAEEAHAKATGSAS